MPWADLVRSLPNQDRQRLGQIDATTKSIIAAYLETHKLISDEILKELPKNLPPSDPRFVAATFRLVSSAKQLKFITERISELNKYVGDLVAKATENLVKLAFEQAPDEAARLNLLLPRRFGPDPVVIERTLPETIETMTGWNRQWRNDLMMHLRSGAVKGEDYDTIAARVVTAGVFKSRTTPVTKATAHALTNTRWLLVRANNDARQLAYQQIAQANDLPIRKTWWAAIGSCCVSCAMLHGQVVDLGQDFPWQDLGTKLTPFKGELPGPPLHPNCRCRILPMTPDVESRLKSAKSNSRKRVAELVGTGG